MFAAAAIIASTALPPSRNTANAAWAASACGATAMPRVPRMELNTENPEQRLVWRFYSKERVRPLWPDLKKEFLIFLESCAQHWCDLGSFAPHEGGLAGIHNPTSLVAQCSARISSDGMFSALLPSVYRNLLSSTAF